LDWVKKIPHFSTHKSTCLRFDPVAVTVRSAGLTLTWGYIALVRGGFMGFLDLREKIFYRNTVGVVLPEFFLVVMILYYFLPN
jgi:hypothetical protein